MLNYLIKLWLSAIFISWFPVNSFSFENGKPFITSFSSKQYQSHNQNWAVIQDNKGLVYIGNNYGLLICEGFDWTLVESQRIISFCKDEEGVIYAGMDGNFGFLQSDKSGKVNYNSLSEKLDKKLQDFNAVWACFSLNEAEYFCTPERIFIFKDKQFLQSIEAGEEGTFHKFFVLNNQLWLRQNNVGLQFLTKENRLKLCPGGDFFADKKVDLLVQGTHEILIGTRENGLMRYADDKITPINNSGSEYFKSNKLYCYTTTKDNRIACGTLSGGIALLNLNGELEEIIDKQDGLNGNTVRFLYTDRQGFLWAALDKGLSLIELNSAFRFYKSKNDVNENVNTIFANKSIVYSGTTNGLYVAQKTSKGISEFKPVTGAENSFFSEIVSLVNPDNTGSTIWALAQNGIFQLNNDKAFFIEEIASPLKTIQLKNKEIAIVTALGLISVFKYADKKWTRLRSFNYDGIATADFNSLLEDGEHIWIGEKNAGVISVNTNELISSDKPNFKTYIITSNTKGSFSLFKAGNKVLTGAAAGIFEYDFKSNKFVKSSFLGNNFSSKSSIYSAFNDSLGNVWMGSDVQVSGELILKQFILALSRGSNRFELVSSPFARIYDIQVNSVFPFSDNEIWFASNDGVFSTKLTYPEKLSNKSIIKEVKIKTNQIDSVIYKGLFLADQSDSVLQIILPYSSNSLEFSFYSTQLIAASETQYITWLEGFDEAYSDWRRAKIKSYTNLPEGNYIFHVKSKDIYGNVFPEAVYKFKVLPPWYRMWWAYLFYLVAAVTAIYYLFRFLNRELYKKIEESKLELKEKNKEITDSINYAQTIQQNMLPEPDAISNVIPKSFVHFRPKDIVSGDFYWFADLESIFPENHYMKGKCIVALGDCTGHGVPGAFMSMIGIEKLNLAISAITELSANKVLSFLNIELKKSLKQRGEESDSKDGMELILCIIDKKNNQVEYAGANRPLLCFNYLSKALTEIKPTKAGIGGGTENSQEFNTVIMDCKKGDRFYLFSDGMTDQFGGEKNKKITKKGLYKLIEDCPEARMERQYAYFENYFTTWMKGYEQTDGMCLIGFEI